MKAMAERMAMNAPLQGTAADFVKIAMKQTDVAIKSAKLESDVELLLQVHDELIYEITDKPEIIKKTELVIKKAMEEVALGTKGESIPLVVDIAKGKRWGSLK